MTDININAENDKIVSVIRRMITGGNFADCRMPNGKRAAAVAALTARPGRRAFSCAHAEPSTRYELRLTLVIKGFLRFSIAVSGAPMLLRSRGLVDDH